MESRVSDTELPQERFAKALFRLHQAYNLLDMNLGLSIRRLENPDDVTKSHSWLANATVSAKIERFRQLIAPKYLADAEVAPWVERAHAARLDRNLYTHAYYDLVPAAFKNDPKIRIPPWMLEKLGVATDISVSFEEYEGMVDNVESIFEEFLTLLKRAIGT